MIVFLSLLVWLYVEDIVSLRVFAALFGAGALVALIGFIDDLDHIPARWRLLGHFLGAGWALFWLGGLPPISIFGETFDLGWSGYFFAAFFLVWLLNLYNFMDGIDGIASIEAITICLGSALTVLPHQVPQVQWYLPLLLASVTMGFLLWNFPVAKIFMGDACSGFLGITIGMLSVQAAWVFPQLLWVWIILLGVFIVDSTYTLLDRILKREKVYRAHRKHAYQIASRRFNSHIKISLAVGFINLLWLTPIAYLVTMEKIDGVAGVCIAYIPIVYLVWKLKKGTGSNILTE